MTIYYKVLDEQGRACHGGSGQWNLPVNGEPGAWMPPIPDPVPCKRGYHICRNMQDLLTWLGLTIWTCEADGLVIPDENKVVVACARLISRLPWDEKTSRLFAADCAEHVLPIFERKWPKNFGPRNAIEAARSFAHGEIGHDELAAAGAAAGVAAGAAAPAAAGAAERDWQAAKLAEYLSITAVTS